MPTQDIAATFVSDGAETEGVIPEGEPFVITASDKMRVAWFQTEDGHEGFFAIAPDAARGWGFTVAACPRTRCLKWCLTRIERVEGEFDRRNS